MNILFLWGRGRPKRFLCSLFLCSHFLHQSDKPVFQISLFMRDKQKFAELQSLLEAG